MAYKLEKIESLSGKQASIYHLIKEDEYGEFSESLYYRFIKENKNSFLNELKNITSRLRTIGHDTGARVGYFKEFEGKYGDGVCALYDEPRTKLRLYCIRIGCDIVVLGGGGHKPKNMRALQDSEKLTDENSILRNASEELTKKIIDRDIYYSENGLDFEGELILDI